MTTEDDTILPRIEQSLWKIEKHLGSIKIGLHFMVGLLGAILTVLFMR